jgi:hypothetical protein
VVGGLRDLAQVLSPSLPYFWKPMRTTLESAATVVPKPTTSNQVMMILKAGFMTRPLTRTEMARLTASRLRWKPDRVADPDLLGVLRAGGSDQCQLQRSEPHATQHLL